MSDGIEPLFDSPEGGRGVVGEPGSNRSTRGRRNVPLTPASPGTEPLFDCLDELEADGWWGIVHRFTEFAAERDRGRLVCQCRRPDPHTVVLFGSWELIDVFECGCCWRPVLSVAGCEE